MARQGRGAAALATAAIGSFVAGTLGNDRAHLPGAVLRQARAAFRPGGIFRADGAGLHHGLGPARGLASARGVTSLLLGLAIGLVGTDVLTGQPRLTFGYLEPAARHRYRRGGGRPVRGGRSALHGLASRSARSRDHSDQGFAVHDAARNGGAPGSHGCAARRLAFPSARCRPAAPKFRPSSPISSRRNSSKQPEEFGKGAIEGVAGPEAANNAAVAGVLVPLLDAWDCRRRRPPPSCSPPSSSII